MFTPWQAHELLNFPNNLTSLGLLFVPFRLGRWPKGAQRCPGEGTVYVGGGNKSQLHLTP